MSEITVDRIFTRDSLESLHIKLRATVGDKLIRLTLTKGVPIVGLSKDATPEDSNAVLQILLTHDITERTPDQVEVAAKRAELDAARESVKGGKVTDKELIAYLLLEVADLRKRIGA